MHNNRTIIRKEIPGEYFFRWNQRWSRNRDSGRFRKVYFRSTRESLLHALSGPMQLPVCNYRRETRAKWVLNEKLSTSFTMKLSSRRKVQPPFLRGSRFLSSLLRTFFSHKDSPSSVPSETSRFQRWKYGILFSVNTCHFYFFKASFSKVETF